MLSTRAPNSRPLWISFQRAKTSGPHACSKILDVCLVRSQSEYTNYNNTLSQIFERESGFKCSAIPNLLYKAHIALPTSQ